MRNLFAQPHIGRSIHRRAVAERIGAVDFRFRYGLVILLATWSLQVCAYLAAAERPSELPPSQTAASEQLYFEDRVASIIEKRCLKCHNAQAKKGNLDLSTLEGMIRGGDSGEIFQAGNADKSLLYESVHSHEMPPEGEPLPDIEIEAIKRWINQGAKFQVSSEKPQKPVGEHDVLPIFLLRCTACHGAELKRGGLDLSTVEAVYAGGKSGPAFVAGKPSDSRLVQRIESQLCPPTAQMLKYFVRRPTSYEIEKLRAWIEVGAPMAHAGPSQSANYDVHEIAKQFSDSQKQHWSFQPLPYDIPVPQPKSGEPMQPIDAFIQRDLARHGLSFSPEASREVQIRRVYFDLIGLPPTAAEQLKWAEDLNPLWYSTLVDELLDSPHYGERWGRYWLDVAGYADSEGGVSEDVVRDVAWKYRDYVIRSFNADKPWDRFLLEQLAGDELADFTQPQNVTDEVVDNLIATGFLRMGIDQTGSRTMNFVPERLGVIADAINVVGTGILGLTLECSRCHSHKYDPIGQIDYYRFKAIFQGALDEHDWMTWKNRKLETATVEQLARHKSHNSEIESRLKQLTEQRAAVVKGRQEEYYNLAWPKLAEALQKEILAAVKETPDRRTLRQEELVAQYESEIRPVEPTLIRKHPDLAETLRDIDGQVSELRSRLLPPLEIRALWDRGRPSPTYLLVRGEHDRPGPQVFPGIPTVLALNHEPMSIKPPWPEAPSTGRRLALARWLVAPQHPLTARVLVNRIWSLYFGQGIVKTLDNFGLAGARPTHPELLDWLARKFIQDGWSLKSLHRQIVHSRTYRQASDKDEKVARLDPENLWLSRMNLRRLDAEAIRDSMLAVSGRLDDRMFGPPVPVEVREDGLIMDLPNSDGKFRRSVYLRMRRTEMPSLLTTFDYPEMQPNCSQRNVSTVSLQSLMLNNNATVFRWATELATIVQPPPINASASNDPEHHAQLDACVTRLYRTVLARSPKPHETTAGRQSLLELERLWIASGTEARHARLSAVISFGHSMLNSAEFIYID